MYVSPLEVGLLSLTYGVALGGVLVRYKNMLVPTKQIIEKNDKNRSVMMDDVDGSSID